MKELRGKRVWAVCSVVAAALLAPAAASAGTITPTDGVDEFGTNPSHCALREAIQAAQGNGTFSGCAITGGDSNADTIRLNPAVVYHLSLAGVEDANASGDLDIIGAAGDQELTITTTGPGRATIDANGDGIEDPFTATGDRVLTIGAGGNAIQDVDLVNLDITDGEAGTVGAGGILHEAGLDPRIINSTVRENKAAAGGGGGIRFLSGSPLISNSEISDNTAGFYGGIWIDDATVGIVGTTIEGNQANDPVGFHNGGGLGVDSGETASLINSTVISNTTLGYGGGAAVFGTLNLVNATIASNTADVDTISPGDDGGGVFVGGPVNARNSIIANNVDASVPPGDVHPDCSGPVTSQGYNLIELTGPGEGCTVSGDTTGVIVGLPPNLGDLAANGGPTRTHRLLPGSPALQAGNPAEPGSGGFACEATDQRGFPRPGGTNPCDIGAYEAQPTVLGAIGNQTVAAGQTLSLTVPALDLDLLDLLTYSIQNQPPGSGFHTATGAFTWTPTAAQVGTYPDVHFGVYDGIFESANPITITVTPPPAAPATGRRAAALKKCKKKKRKARKRCRRRARKLPL